MTASEEIVWLIKTKTLYIYLFNTAIIYKGKYYIFLELKILILWHNTIL
jgi:hypothetical protein